MTTTNLNGQRRSLADQIDRLDHILDGLADGLNDAVAQAVKQAVSVAVQEAVRGILSEVLTNPDLLSKLRGLVSQNLPAASTPASQAVVKEKSRVSKLAGKIGTWLGAGWRAVRNTSAAVMSRMASVLCTARRQVRLVRQFRVPLLTAVVVGAAAGYGAYYGGPFVAAIAGWLAGFTTTLTVQVGIWLRGTFGSVPADYA